MYGYSSQKGLIFSILNIPPSSPFSLTSFSKAKMYNPLVMNREEIELRWRDYDGGLLSRGVVWCIACLRKNVSVTKSLLFEIQLKELMK